MYVAVNIKVLDKKTREPLPRVVVRALLANYVTFATNITNDDGVAAFLLAENQTYQIRMLCSDALSTPPLRLVLPEGDAPVELEALLEIMGEHASPDPDLCVVYGSIAGPDGSPLRDGVHIRVQGVPEGQVVRRGTGYLFLAGTSKLYKPHEGVFDIPLRRGATYDIQISLLEDQPFRVQAPLQGSIALDKLLWPYLERLIGTWPTMLSEGAVSEVDVRILLSNGQELPADSVNLEFVSSDPEVLTATYAYGKVTLRALQPGVATLTLKYDPSHSDARRGENKPQTLPFPLDIEVV